MTAHLATLVRLASRPRANLLSILTLALLSLAGAAEAALVVLFGWDLALELGNGGDGAAVGALASAFDGVLVVLTWVSAAAWLSFLAWQFLTVRRVHRLGMGEDLMSPSAGLFLALSLAPYGVIKQLRSAVAPGDGALRGRLLGVWWASWLTTLVFLGAGGRLMDSGLAIVDDQRVLSLLGLSAGVVFTATFGLTAWVVHVISRASSRLGLTASLLGEGDAAGVAGPGHAIEGPDLGPGRRASLVRDGIEVRAIRTSEPIEQLEPDDVAVGHEMLMPGGITGDGHGSRSYRSWLGHRVR